MFKIEKSTRMSIKSGLEDYTIRMTLAARKKLNVEPGDLITVINTPLQVDTAFKEDYFSNKNGIFATEKTLKKLGYKKIELDPYITIGCDPEFFLLNTNTNQLFPPYRILRKNDKIGYDGRLVELRPDPSIYPDIVTRNIKELLRKFQGILDRNGLDNLEMVAKSSGWNNYAGFHVHFGLPKNLLSSIMSSNNSKKILYLILHVLDYYVATICTIIEGDVDYSRRCSVNISYGKLSDYRINYKTLEYRVPGGALLKHPKLSTGLLSICSLVVHDILERLKIYTNGTFIITDRSYTETLKQIYTNVLPTKNICRLVYKKSVKDVKPEVEKIWQDLTYMINYEIYARHLLEFKNIIKNQISSYIKRNWLTR